MKECSGIPCPGIWPNGITRTSPERLRPDVTTVKDLVSQAFLTAMSEMIRVTEQERLTRRVLRFTIASVSKSENDNASQVTLPLESITPSKRKPLETVIAKRPPDDSKKTESIAIDQKQI